MAPKAEEQVAETKPVEDKPIHTPAPDDPPAEASPAPKPAGFKPRFNAAKMAPKKEDTFEQEVPMEIKADDLDSVSERTKEADNEDIEIKPAAEVGPKWVLNHDSIQKYKTSATKNRGMNYEYGRSF